MKPYIDKFPCRLFKIKGNNSIEKVKRVKSIDNTTKPLAQKNVEMNQGSAEEQLSFPRSKSSSSDIFSITGVASSSNWSTEASTSTQEGKVYSNLEQTSENQSLFYISSNQEISKIDAENQKGKPNNDNNNTEASDMEIEFTNPLCSVCNNRRPKFGSKRDFSYAELYNATHGFSQKNFLSEGGFGEVYKGQLDGMTMIAVKQHKSASFQGEKEFKSEVNVLSKARHENVVMLLGSCSEKNTRLLVYEYVCNGSLDQHLSEHSRSPLSWKERIKVAVGAANGLLYLHNNNIIHRDMRPNNILITHDHHPLARPLLRERNYSDLVDERINDSLDILQLFWMVRLAEKCLSRDPQKRLSMVAVVNALNGIVEGSTCDIKMKEYSPTRSDSSYIESEYDEADEEEIQGYESEGESQSHNTEFASPTRSTKHQMMMQMFVRQPPSPPIPPMNSSTSSIWLYDKSNIHCEAQKSEGNVEILNSKERLLDDKMAE